MATYTIHQIPTARAALLTDELEVQATGGGASARVTAASLSGLVPGPTGATGASGATGATGSGGAFPGGATGTVQINGGGGTFVGLPVIGFVRLVAVDLTAAQLRSNFSAPAELVVSPGSNDAWQIIHAASKLNIGSIPFQNVDLNIVYTGTTDSLLDTSLPMSNASEEIFLTVTNGSNGFVAADVVDTGLSIKGNAGEDDLTGAILTSSINAPGSGYAANDTFDVEISGSVTAQGVVDTVGALGVVVTYHLSAGGSGFLPGDTKTTTATTGIGTGLTLDIDTITPANSTARIYLTLATLEMPP